jgi:tetratricopeptide (TPR) repeat protein
LQAREVLRVAFKRFPKEATIAAKLGLALFNEGHVSQARKLMDYAHKTGTETVESLEAAATFYRTTGQSELAVELLKNAMELAADIKGKLGKHRRSQIALALAEAAKDAGDMEYAKTVLRDVLAKDKTNTRAWLILSSIIKFGPEQTEIKRMENLLRDKKAPLSGSQKIDLGFALGKAFMDIGNASKAMAHLRNANGVHRQRLQYQSDATCKRLKNYGTCFDPAEFAKTRNVQGLDGPSPVFIVGMPRSGTTLVEQILATHPDVYGADELTTLPRLKNAFMGRDFPDAPDSPKRLTSPDRLEQLAKAYRDESRQHLDRSDNPYRFLIDKQPGNFMFCGLIAMAFSDAKIIHCKRNPLDTCLSCFSKYFASGQSFTYDLKELGEYYRAYDDLMRHWRDILPNDLFIEVKYEDVIADQERETRRLVEFLGLGWDPALLTFHETRRTVRTASANQVRQPIYKSSIARWRPYEKELEPLITALNIDISKYN